MHKLSSEEPKPCWCDSAVGYGKKAFGLGNGKIIVPVSDAEATYGGMVGSNNVVGEASLKGLIDVIRENNAKRLVTPTAATRWHWGVKASDGLIKSSTHLVHIPKLV
jgi:hypothetical protein